MTEYKKYKCVFCGYEMASCASLPRCGKCKSRRLSTIEAFTVLKPYRQEEQMTKIEQKPKVENIELEKKQVKKKVESDIDKDIWGSDDAETDEE